MLLVLRVLVPPFFGTKAGALVDALDADEARTPLHLAAKKGYAAAPPVVVLRGVRKGECDAIGLLARKGFV